MGKRTQALRLMVKQCADLWIAIDAIYDEDRSQIRTGHGPVNMTRMRRFAVGLLKSSGVKKHHSENAPNGSQG